MKYLKWLEKQNFNAKNKTIIVTGANSGIGFFACKYFAHLGAIVVMACRNKQRALSAKQKIEKEIPNSKIHIEIVDISSKTSIENFANNVKQKFGEIDILVNNAGVYMPSQKSTLDGFDMTIGTNFLGTYFLTECLKSLLKTNGRIVFTTSIVDQLYKYSKNISLLEPESSKHKTYKKSKFLLSCYAQSLEKDSLILSKNIKVVSAHPGVSSTNLFSSSKTTFSKGFSKVANAFLKLFTHCPEKASLCLVYASLKESFAKTRIAPKGLFSISGFPTETTHPSKIMKNYKIVVDEVIKKVST